MNAVLFIHTCIDMYIVYIILYVLKVLKGVKGVKYIFEVDKVK